MKLDLEKFTVDYSLIEKTEKEFRDIIKERYKGYDENQLNLITDKFYGKDSAPIRQNIKNRAHYKNYLNCIEHEGRFVNEILNLNHRNNYRIFFNRWREIQKDEIIKYGLQDVDDGLIVLFQQYLESLFELFKTTHLIFSNNDNRYKVKFNILEAQVSANFENNITEIITSLDRLVLQERFPTAIKRRKHVILLFEAVEHALNSVLISFKYSPIYESFLEGKNRVKEAEIDKEEIKIILTSENEKTSENESRDETLNEYDEIFNGGKSYNLFKKIHNQYKSDKAILTANYSFVFYAMLKDGFIVCTGNDFIRFLSKNYQIEIDRIDSRQTGSNKRQPFYESLKSAIFTQ